VRVVEGLLLRGGASGDVVAFPQLGEVGTVEQEFADEGGQVGGVGIGAGQGAQAGYAAADPVVSVGIKVACREVGKRKRPRLPWMAGQSSMPA
jgi:hypothetical protein